MNYNIRAAELHRATLQLDCTFCEPELKASYRKLRGQWHPDRHMTDSSATARATEQFKFITVAYEFLSECLQDNAGVYRAPEKSTQQPSWSDLQPRRRYEGKAYTLGFPDLAATEIFLLSSHIVSAGYNRIAQILYIKFSGNSVYKYFGVPENIFEAFLAAPSHGKFGHQYVYSRYRQERC